MYAICFKSDDSLKTKNLKKTVIYCWKENEIKFKKKWKKNFYKILFVNKFICFCYNSDRSLSILKDLMCKNM